MVAAFIFVDFHLINFDYLKGLFGKAGIEMVSQSIFILDGHRDLMEQYVLFQNVFLIYLFFTWKQQGRLKKKKKAKKNQNQVHKDQFLYLVNFWHGQIIITGHQQPITTEYCPSAWSSTAV